LVPHALRLCDALHMGSSSPAGHVWQGCKCHSSTVPRDGLASCIDQSCPCAIRT
jgi:hypothetical protein